MVACARHSETEAAYAVFDRDGDLVAEPADVNADPGFINPLPAHADTAVAGRYRHFKGGEYEFVARVGDLLLYRAANGGVWLRPFAMAFETVERNGETKPRFVRLGDVTLRAYTDADLALTLALETDPVAMAELGGPRDEADLRDVHMRRLDDPFWFVIADAATGEALGSIGVWATEHDGHLLWETGWMVLPAAHGRGVAGAALTELLARAREEGGFDEIHAFPGVTNAPSNRLCEKFGFELIGAEEFVFANRALQCHHWRLRLTR